MAMAFRRSMPRVFVCVLLVLTLQLLTACASQRVASNPWPQATAAGAYAQWTGETLCRNEANLPAITAAAEAIAPLLIADKNLAVRGNGLNSELGARAGGFFFYKGVTGKPGDVAVLAISSQPASEPDLNKHLTQSIAEIIQFKQAGSTVIVIASIAQLEKHGLLDTVRQYSDHLLDNFAPADDGLFIDASGKAVVPTLPVANAITGWVLKAELFAALTRLGRTPAMYQSVAIPGARERNTSLGKIRFHDDLHVDPIAPGVLGKAYLTGLHTLHQDVAKANNRAIVHAADRLFHVIASGGKVYVYASAHYPPYHFGNVLAADPGVTTLLNRGARRFLATPGEQDAILALGYAMRPGDSYWGDPEVFTKAGRGVVWVITTYDTPADAIPARDILVDQRWPAGDAVVDVPGYPVRVFPPSGVITEMLGWAIIAQTHQQIQGQPLKLSSAESSKAHP